MYLKAIEIHGFKSFANKTVFRFHNGVTAIVGPNGSGKSNVADAVRWVLGEQRVKQLRGGSMQDVIFAGTENRKPLSYASVSITLDNADHVLPVSYDEVTVTRRLYRSGESEYLINGTQCRLRDISELFYDTGIGKEGYSIIGQGQIEKILSGKPEDRRELFDEAVGIVKFKRRKSEAQKKLISEQQNLSRVDDILTELKRQVGPLERQAEKARIYLNKRDELKAYDVNNFLFEFQDLKERAAQTQKTLELAQEDLKQIREQIEQIRSQYEEAAAQLEILDARQQQQQAHIAEDQLERQQKESRIELLREQIRALSADAQQKQQRLIQLREQTAQTEEQLKNLEEAQTALTQHEQDVIREEEEADADYRQMSRETADLRSKIKESRETVIRILGERAEIQAQIKSCETLIEQTDIQRSQLQGRLLQLKSRQTDQTDESTRLRDAFAAVTQSIDTLTEQSRAKSEQLEELQGQLTQHNQTVEQKQQAYHRIASRLETLKNIAERYDGYGSSIRRVMERKASEKGLLGVVADLITTDKRYETAIETALGGSIQNIVTQDEETAKRMIGYLKENRFGRATFLPLTAMKHAQPFGQEKALRETGVIGLASDLVKADRAYADLVRYLLGRTVVTDNIDSAVRLAKAYRYSLRIVTLEGDLITPGGSMSGGAYKNSSNLLGRRREIEDLERQTAACRKELGDLQQTIDQERAARAALRDEIRDFSIRLQEKYLEQNTVKLSLGQAEGGVSETARTARQLQAQQQEAVKRIEELNGQKIRLNDSLEKSKRSEEAEISMQKLDEERLHQMTEQENESRERIEQIHVELASCEQKGSYLEQEAQRLQEEMDNLKAEAAGLSGETDTSARAAEKEEEIERCVEAVKQLTVSIEQQQAEVKKTAEAREQAGARQRDCFSKREELTQQEGILDKECYRLSSQIEKLEETRENRISYMWEEYELTYQAALSLKREDLGSQSEWKKQAAALKKEIRELGSVNVNAIDEYKEVSERYTFLSGQHEDLVKAQAALEKIIKELDEGMRRQFREQFARIQEEFGKTFKQLFGGGQGTLTLVDDEDILEAGIRIDAQPPGKKLQNMMQLSGGEKSLTAIALLFAIQNLKPSPFCLLDEIEAALDENNVERYAGYLHKLTKHTQFIIITHRRGTMAAADRLYGITMQEKGVSALVSVNLLEDELT